MFVPDHNFTKVWSQDLENALNQKKASKERRMPQLSPRDRKKTRC